MKRVIHPILGGNRSWRAVLSVSLAGASLIAGRGLGGSGGTATLVVPPAYENVDAANGSSWMQLQMRLQQAYGAPQFPGHPIVIREIRWRPSARYGQAFSSTISNFQVNLSTTGRTPTGLSSVLASNLGPDDTVVFQGALSLSSAFSGPAGGNRPARATERKDEQPDDLVGEAIDSHMHLVPDVVQHGRSKSTISGRAGGLKEGEPLKAG